MTREEIVKERKEARDKVREMVDGGTTCTLDGKPAVIAGFSLDFGVICDQTDGCRKAEWSWPAILGVLTKHGGNFTTL